VPNALAASRAKIKSTGGAWHVKHDGEPIGNYPSKEAAFEAAVAAALEQIREGYEVQISVPGKRIDPVTGALGGEPNHRRHLVIYR
jgi:hypothetical protein